MHIDHYKFREHPFQMTPDARLFYPSSGHSRAYAHLTYGLAQREGFVVVTGEVGAGKTTLIERLCSELTHAAGIAEAALARRNVGAAGIHDQCLGAATRDALAADGHGSPADTVFREHAGHAAWTISGQKPEVEAP